MLTFSFGYAAANATWPSFYGEMFNTRVRFSGVAIGTQLGFLMAGFAPTIVTALGGVQEGGWVVISAFTAVIAVIAAISASTARETRDVPTEELGLKRPAGSDGRAGPGRGALTDTHECPAAGGDPGGRALLRRTPQASSASACWAMRKAVLASGTPQ